MGFEKPRSERRTDNDLQSLRRDVKNNPDNIEAIERLQGELERAGMRGAFVPVEVSQDLINDGVVASETRRWVEWKKVNDTNGQEILGRIEKIVRVKLIAEPVDQQIAKGSYVYDELSEELTLSDREIQPQSGEQELFLSKFDRDGGVSTENIETWLEQNSLRGATLQEFIALSVQIPEEQRRGYLLTLDEAWRSRGRVLVLGRGRRGRLALTDRDHRWAGDVRPLAARKSL